MGALQWLPVQATAALGIDAGAIAHLPYYTRHRSELELGDFGRAIASAEACGIGRDAWRTITLAAGDAAMAVVMRADGIGERERLTCLGKRLGEGDAEGFAVAAGEGMPELTFSGGTAGWAPDPCTLVIASGSWVEDVRARIAGRGDAIARGSLVDAIGRADERKHFWFVSAASKSPVFGQLGGLVDMATSIDFSAGFAVISSMRFVDATSASKAAVDLRKQIDSMQGMFVTFGFSKDVLATMQLSASGLFVTFSMRGSETDLDNLRASFTTRGGGT